jgi:GNAT superfamily N-acetyltransferase
METLWRMTCFVVDKNYRRRGVASAALKAALECIRSKGGGLVEAIPVSKTDQGPGYMYTGTVSMFERAGLKIVGPFGSCRNIYCSHAKKHLVRRFISISWS